MKIGVLGTGVVGRTIAGGLAANGHEVMIGTRDVDALLARTEPHRMGTPPFSGWHGEHGEVGLGTFAQVGDGGELLVNATVGTASIDALRAAGAADVDGRIVIDTSNPLDFSAGFPPSLWVGNTDSLGERIQAAFPSARVVKTWNTMTAALMIDPAAVGEGEHTNFVCGNDAEAKATVRGLLQAFGWRDVLDLGDISNARAVEAYVTLWVRLMSPAGTSMFNVKVVR